MYKIILTSLILANFAVPAHAWGPTGHRVTGALAEPLLSHHARAEVQKILGVEGLSEVSTWPDFMGSSPEPFWQKTARPFHYVTIPDGKTYAEVGAPPEGNAITALESFAKTLKDPTASSAEKALALRFTIHLVGDLHQPLHAGNGTDRGGNNFKVMFFEEMSNLHAVWDYGMIDRERLSYTEKAAWLRAKITHGQVANWFDPDPLVWIEESAQIRKTIYPDNRILSWKYPYEHMAQVNLRLSQSGVRLAAYLNALYPNTPK
ncbi:Endonuclease [hydrothermal vent metagenome]|uniref:Endonuclease n=1 Tax=hydrothermal vent metagenome TaxID=652676 RepID=A0A3B0RPS9_9ZZZZ